MFSWMAMLRRLATVLMIFLSAFLTACGTLFTEQEGQIPTGAPTFTRTVAATTIVTAVPTRTATLTPMPTPDLCNSAQWQDEVKVISEDAFSEIVRGPGDYNRILVERNSAWADFRQEAHGEQRSAGVTFHETAFGPEWGTGVNAAVLLVTYGVDRDWALPANGDLISEVEGIRDRLFQHHLAWALEEVDKNQYPSMNAATYALYRYFDGDLSKLELWCRTYVQVYGQAPVR